MAMTVVMSIEEMAAAYFIIFMVTKEDKQTHFRELMEQLCGEEK